MIKFLYSNNKLIGEIKYTPEIFRNYKKHSHCMLCLGIIEKGSLSIEFSSQEKKLQPHQIAIFNPFQPHKINNFNAKGYYTIYINLDWALDVQKKIYPHLINFSFSNKNIIENKEITQICENIVMEKKVDKNTYFLLKIIKNILTPHINSTQNFHSNISPLTQKIKKYIEFNNTLSLSIEEIAKYLHYNKSYLIRVFKKDMGITPQQYILNYKVNMAKQHLLTDTEESLIELSYKYGFYDQSHFNRNFKRIFATTPKSYKKSILYNN